MSHDIALHTSDGNVTITTLQGTLTLTPELTLELFQSLPGALQRTTLPNMVVSDDRTSVTCPHCQHTTGLDSLDALEEVDWSCRWNTGFTGLEDVTDVSFSQGDAEHETVVFRCAQCQRLVDLPADTFSITWS